MHKIQEKILAISKTHNLTRLSLREIGNLIGVDHPQKVKHHLMQLQKKHHLNLNRNINIFDSIKNAKQFQPAVQNVPILGYASCGQPCALAEDKIQGYLKISSSLLIKRKNIFALKTDGDSMNKADIKGNNIDDGDYVIVDFADKEPRNNDYVLSIIDNCANIKKFVKDRKNNQILLLSESTRDCPPIVISMTDNFMINGKVIQVIKQ